MITCISPQEGISLLKSAPGKGSSGDVASPGLNHHVTSTLAHRNRPLWCKYNEGSVMKAQYLSSWVNLVPSRNHIQEVGSPLAIVVKRPVETIGPLLTARCATRGHEPLSGRILAES
jgi:hypothetical protein